MTFDDFRAGPDGIAHTADDVFLNPIAGVKVFVVGLENTVFTTTDAQGNFTLPSVPGGNVKLAIDGNTATNKPAGFYFPEMVMDLKIVPGTANTVMDSMGETADQIANAGRKEVYLPRLQTSILQDVSAIGNTMIGVDAKSAPNLTDAQRPFLQLEVQPGSVLGADGQPLSNPQIGISTVPPELIRDMLPPGLLQHAFDITIQAPNASTFAEPLKISFPNLFNAAPGTKLNLMSFDHTTGRLELNGTATVSPDGLSVVTDPGSGVTKPGWTHVAPAGRPVPSPPTPVPTNTPPATPNGTPTPNPPPPLPNNPCPPGSVPNPDFSKCGLFTIGGGLVCGYGLATGGGGNPVGIAVTVLSCILSGLSAADCDNVPPCILGGSTPRLASVASTAVGNGIWAAISGLATQVLDVVYPFVVKQETVPFGVENQVRGLLAQMEAIVGSDLLSYLNSVFGEITEGLRQKGNDTLGNEPGYPMNYAIVTESAGGDRQIFRGMTQAYGKLEIFIPSDSKVVAAGFYDRITDSVSWGPGYDDTRLGYGWHRPILASCSELPDLDSDGLADAAELVLGTSNSLADTDHDGVEDGPEVRSGLSPIGGRSANTGIISSVNLNGEAKAVVISNPNGLQPLAYVASGSGGLAVVSAGIGAAPAVISEIDLSGDAVDVAVDSGLALAAVAAGVGGLNFLDIVDTRAPVLTHSIPINATQVEIHAGIAYANDGTVIRAYSLETGELFQTVSVGNDAITGIAIEGDHLYTMDAGNHLTVFNLSGPSVVKQGSITAPVGGGKLTVGDGVAYISTESATNSAAGGYATVDVSNPNALTLLSGVDAINIAGHGIALNGSGLAVAVGSPAVLGNLVHLLRVTDVTKTNNLVTQFTLPADPQDVTIANGMAFIADGTGGLVVVNYLSADTAGVPPTATLTHTGADRDPVAPGVQVQAGSLIPIKLTVADDTQVASVELLKDGVVIGTDTSFPFEFGAIPAGLTAGGQTALQIRATDTGGNVGLSNTLTFDLIADTTAPALTGSNPAEGGTRSGGLQTVRLFFNEALTQTDLTADHFTLTGPGGATVPVKTVTFSQLGKQVSLTFDPLAAGAYTLRLDAANLHDLSGNALGTTPLDRHFSVVNATKTFINADGGDWNSLANWENGTLPTAGDIVALPLNPGKAVTISSGAIKVQSILTEDTLQVTGGSLTLTGASDIAGILKVSNGADLIVDGLNASLTAQNALLDGGDLISVRGGDFHFPTLQFFTFGTLNYNGTNSVFDAPLLTNVDNSRFLLSGGAQLSIPASSYRADGLPFLNDTLMSVAGNGTRLSFPNLQVFNDGWFDDDNGRVHTVSASSNGVIEMNALQSITAPARNSYDRLDFNVATGGQINMNSLATIIGTGSTRFDISAGTMTVGTFTADKTDIAIHAGGLLHALGNFTMASNRSVTVDITGTAITQFGRIQVDGIAAIVGTLNIARPTGFIPSVSDAFAILTYTGHTGAFGTVTGTTAGPRIFNLAYNPLDLTLNVI